MSENIIKNTKENKQKTGLQVNPILIKNKNLNIFFKEKQYDKERFKKGKKSHYKRKAKK